MLDFMTASIPPQTTGVCDKNISKYLRSRQDFTVCFFFFGQKSRISVITKSYGKEARGREQEKANGIFVCLSEAGLWKTIRFRIVNRTLMRHETK